VAPVPEYLTKAQAAGIDPDADWMQQAETIPAARFSPRARKNRYVPAIPMEFIRQTLVAGDALALLPVALAVMRMHGTSEIAIGPALLAEVGTPANGCVRGCCGRMPVCRNPFALWWLARGGHTC
jgi:hypothetical protein